MATDLLEFWWISPGANNSLTLDDQKAYVTRGEAVTFKFNPTSATTRDPNGNTLKLLVFASGSPTSFAITANAINADRSIEFLFADTQTEQLPAGEGYGIQVWDETNKEMISYLELEMVENPDLAETDDLPLADRYVPLTRTITIDGTTYDLSANRSWTTSGGGGGGSGNVSNSGTPTSGQAAEWVSATAIQGVAVTGTGNYAKSNSPTFVTPALGTPSAVVLTNGTGLPISTGVSGLGTSVATALAVAVGSAGAVVINGGALGTPSSATLTNATGLPISTGVSGLGSGVATLLGSFTSANLRSAITDETGTQFAVFSNGPTLTSPTITTSIVPTVSGGATIGTAVSEFSTVYLVAQAQIRFDDGSALISHDVGDILTLSGTDVRLGSTAGTNTASVVTVGGTQTLTNKTLTSPTLTTPVLGTPSSGTLTNCTGLPVAGITASTSTALGVGSIELGHASDTTIARVSAGVVSVEGVNVVTISATQTLTNKTLTAPTINAATMTGRIQTARIDFGTQVDNGNFGSGTKNIDWTAGNYQKLMQNGNHTLTFTAPSGCGTMTLELIADATGGWTAIWPTITWLNTDGATTTPPPTLTANQKRLVTLQYNGTKYRGQYTPAFTDA